MYDFLDGLPSIQNGFFCGSQGSYEDAYYEYICSISSYGKPDVQQKIGQVKANYEADTLTVYYRNNEQKRPFMGISGNLAADAADWYVRSTPVFQMNFKSQEWEAEEEEPISLSVNGKDIPLSQIIQREKYSFSIRIYGLGCYEVNRGSWFRPELFQYSDSIQTGLAVTRDTFFAPNRDIRLPLQKVLLIYKMTITHDFSLPMLRARCLAPQLMFLGMPVEEAVLMNEHPLRYLRASNHTSVLGITLHDYKDK